MEYRTSECSERVKYKVEQEKRILIYTSSKVLFCLLYKPTNEALFDDFAKFSEHSPKIL